MKEIPLGSRIRVTGICMLTDANPFNGEVPFNILMRDFDDITVVARPPWLNVRHLMMIVGVLLGLVIALGMRGWYVERRNRRKIGSLAYWSGGAAEFWKTSTIPSRWPRFWSGSPTWCQCG